MEFLRSMLNRLEKLGKATCMHQLMRCDAIALWIIHE